MSGEYIEKTKIGKDTGKKVLIVKGGWSCNAGYMVWSYVARDNETFKHYAKTLYDRYIVRIEEKLFEPETKLGSEYSKELFNACKEYVEKNGYFCDTIITMRTD